MMEVVQTSETLVNSHQSTRGTTQKTAIFIVNAVRSSSHERFSYFYDCVVFWRVGKVLGDYSGVGNQSEYITLKLMGISLSLDEFSPYDQFSSNELRS
jgi:hypothetical protein